MGGAAFARALAATLCLIGVACSQTSQPPDSTAQTGCVTDFSCPYGQECVGNGCEPIGASLYPHIQTASTLHRGPLDGAETVWRAQHFDMLVGGVRADEVRAVNPNARMFEYVIGRYHVHDGVPKPASDWAVAHGYDPEDFYLHYREDVDVPTWESIVVVPGFPPGRVPGWNPQGGGNPASAASRDQSRVIGYYIGSPQPWYLANVNHAGYRAFLSHKIAGLIDGTWYNNQLNATGPIDGVMVDEAVWYPLFGEGLLDRSMEYYGITIDDHHPYTYAVEAMFPRLAQDMMNTFGRTTDIMPNYGHVSFLNYPNRCAQNIQATTPWIYGEVWVTYTATASPISGANRCITYDNDYVQGVREIVRQTRRGGRRVLGARDRLNGTAGTDRGKLLTLGLYYLVHNRHTYYQYESAGITNPAHVSSWNWNPAAQYDVGQPDVVPAGSVDFEGRAGTKEHYVFATGPDPVDPGLTYRVLARRFTNALVLVKLLPAGSTVDNTSITTHPLGGSYGLLQADGLVGAAVTQADIRNNEALILIPLN